MYLFLYNNSPFIKYGTKDERIIHSHRCCLFLNLLITTCFISRILLYVMCIFFVNKEQSTFSGKKVSTDNKKLKFLYFLKCSNEV